MPQLFTLRVNGADREVAADGNTPLVYVLRNDLGLKGTRFGCGTGHCGACTVLFDGNPVPSCDTPLWAAEGHEVTTIEGLHAVHPLQRAFVAEQAAQCGYCTSGVIMAAAALLARNADPNDEEIVRALERNLCRCGAHGRMLRAVRRAAQAMRR